jgi:hypothetical protein
VRGDVVGPIVLVALATAVYVAAARIPAVPVPGALGPDVWPRLAAARVLLGLYVAAAPVIGFPLANALFLATFMWVAGLHRPFRVGASSVAITVALLYLFVKVVYLPLPRGEGAFHDATLGLYRVLGLM